MMTIIDDYGWQNTRIGDKQIDNEFNVYMFNATT